MGDRMLHRRAFPQRGRAALGPDLRAQLVLELFILPDGQAPPLPDPGSRAPRADWTRVTGTGQKLGVLAWDHWHGMAVWTGDRPVCEVQGKVLLGEQGAALRPGTGNDIHTLRRPLGYPWARHVAQVDIQLQQTWPALQHLRYHLDHCMLWLVGRAHHHLAGHFAIKVQHKVFLEPVEWFGAALATVAHIRVLNGDTPIRGHVLLDTLSTRSTLRVWFRVLCRNLGDGIHDRLQGWGIRREALMLLQPSFPAVYLLQHQAQCLLPSLWLPPVKVQCRFEAALSHQYQSCFFQNGPGRRAQFLSREAHRFAQRMPEQVQRVFHAASAEQG